MRLQSCDVFRGDFCSSENRFTEGTEVGMKITQYYCRAFIDEEECYMVDCKRKRFPRYNTRLGTKILITLFSEVFIPVNHPSIAYFIVLFAKPFDFCALVVFLKAIFLSNETSKKLRSFIVSLPDSGTFLTMFIGVKLATDYLIVELN